MARPVKSRRICGLPEVTEFFPGDGEAREAVVLTLDEFEAIRLIDRLELSQEDCAAQMNVARTTVQYIYDSARKKLAEALVEGKGIRIGGGIYELCPNSDDCCKKTCRREECENCLKKGNRNCRECRRDS